MEYHSSYSDFDFSDILSEADIYYPRNTSVPKKNNASLESDWALESLMEDDINPFLNGMGGKLGVSQNYSARVNSNDNAEKANIQQDPGNEHDTNILH